MADERTGLGDMRRDVFLKRDDASEVGTYEAFMKEIREGLRDGLDAEEATKAVLCTLTQRLSRSEREEFEAELPSRLACLTRACAQHGGAMRARRMQDDFLQDVADHLRLKRDQAESLVRTLFVAIRERLSDDQVHNVAAQLPDGLADLFRRPV